MSRFLFVVPPLTGHTNPTISVAAELSKRGHEVAWAAHHEVVEDLLPEGARLIPVSQALPDGLVGDMTARSKGLRGATAFKFLWEEFMKPLAHSMVPGLEAAFDEYAPDVAIVDQQTIAGALVARRKGVPWATSATTAAEFTNPYAHLPKLGEWVQNNLREFQIAHGVSEAEAASMDLRFSEHLVLIFSSHELTAPDAEFPPHYRFVGPSISQRPENTADFPWEHLEGAPSVLVSLGTINAEAGGRFYAKAVEALGGRDLRVVLVGPPDVIGPVPDNISVQSYVPQLAVLDRVDAVVSHAGQNTVSETLSRGLPLVVAPIRDDQPVIAQQVVDSGAGLRLRFGRVSAADIAEAVDTVLGDPSYRQAAERIRQSFERAGGPAAAAAALESLT